MSEQVRRPLVEEDKPEQSETKTELEVERYRYWQIILASIFMVISAPLVYFSESIVTWYQTRPVVCTGCCVTITSHEAGDIVYVDKVLITGTATPKGKCNHLFLIVQPLTKNQAWFVSDYIVVEPDGSWSATAHLDDLPTNIQLRIVAVLCSYGDAYQKGTCMGRSPNKGVRSKSIIIERR